MLNTFRLPGIDSTSWSEILRILHFPSCTTVLKSTGDILKCVSYMLGTALRLFHTACYGLEVLKLRSLALYVVHFPSSILYVGLSALNDWVELKK